MEEVYKTIKTKDFLLVEWSLASIEILHLYCAFAQTVDNFTNII